MPIPCSENSSFLSYLFLFILETKVNLKINKKKKRGENKVVEFIQFLALTNKKQRLLDTHYLLPVFVMYVKEYLNLQKN